MSKQTGRAYTCHMLDKDNWGFDGYFNNSSDQFQYKGVWNVFLSDYSTYFDNSTPAGMRSDPDRATRRQQYCREMAEGIRNMLEQIDEDC